MNLIIRLIITLPQHCKCSGAGKKNTTIDWIFNIYSIITFFLIIPLFVSTSNKYTPSSKLEV